MLGLKSLSLLEKKEKEKEKPKACHIDGLRHTIVLSAQRSLTGRPIVYV